MSKIKAVILWAAPTPEVRELLDPLSDRVDFTFLPGGQGLVEAIADAEVVYGSLGPEDFARARRLRWVQHHATGVDNMLYPAFIDSDVSLTSLGGAITTTVADHAMALLLALARRLPVLRDHQRRREWKVEPGLDLEGRTLGVLGMGRIGQAIARRAAAFDMDVIGCDLRPMAPPPGVRAMVTLDALDEWLAVCQALVCALPQTEQTHRLLGADRFARMPAGALLVNISRGGVVDEDALVQALHEGQLAGAGLDVTDTEPLPPESPLWDAPGLLLTPHSAGFSDTLSRRKIGWFAANLKRYCNDQPLEGLVDKRRGF